MVCAQYVPFALRGFQDAAALVIDALRLGLRIFKSRQGTLVFANGEAVPVGLLLVSDWTPTVCSSADLDAVSADESDDTYDVLASLSTEVRAPVSPLPWAGRPVRGGCFESAPPA